jgi:hypothetical protein
MVHFLPARSAKRASRFEREFLSDHLDRSFSFQQQSIYGTCHRTLQPRSAQQYLSRILEHQAEPNNMDSVQEAKTRSGQN